MKMMFTQAESDPLDFINQASKAQADIWSKVKDGATKLYTELQDVIRERDSLISILGKLNVEKEKLTEQVRMQSMMIENLKKSTFTESRVDQKETELPFSRETRDPVEEVIKIEQHEYNLFTSEDTQASDDDYSSAGGQTDVDRYTTPDYGSQIELNMPPSYSVRSVETMVSTESIATPPTERVSPNHDRTSDDQASSMSTSAKTVDRYFTKGTPEYMAMKVAIDDYIYNYDLVSQVSKRDTKLRRAKCIHSILTSLGLPRDGPTSSRLSTRIQTLVTSRRYEGKIRKQANLMGISPRRLKLERCKGRQLQKLKGDGNDHSL